MSVSRSHAFCTIFGRYLSHFNLFSAVIRHISTSSWPSSVAPVNAIVDKLVRQAHSGEPECGNGAARETVDQRPHEDGRGDAVRGVAVVELLALHHFTPPPSPGRKLLRSLWVVVIEGLGL